MAEMYDVYGLGNALVDIQFRIDEDFLREAGIEKGVMTLIDEERQADLILMLANRDYDRASGGSAANTMISLANLGGTSYYACKVVRDEYGEFYLRDLGNAGVASNPTPPGGGITGRCLVFITPDADRTMNTYLGISSTFGPDQIDGDLIAESCYLYVEGYLLASDTGTEAAMLAQSHAQASGAKVALTLSDHTIVGGFGERFCDLVDKGVDLLFCNEEEARAFTGSSTTKEACDRLGERVAEYAVTCGVDGSILRSQGETIEVAGFQVVAVDTNGAGDSFAGAYLFGITNGYSAAEAGKLASYTSSRVVSQYGPRLKESLKGEVERILAL